VDEPAVVPAEDDQAVAVRLLRTAATPDGGRAPAWAASPLAGARRVLEVASGAGALADEFRGRWVGVDPAPGARRDGLVAGTPDALPLRDNAVDGVVLLLALPRLADVDGVFAELRRVLRPSGTLVVVVPAASPRSFAELRWAPVLAPVHRGGWTNRSALDNAGWLLAAADFAVLGDDRAAFTLPLPDAATARALVTDLPRAGWWPPRLTGAAARRAEEALVRRAGPGRTLPVPLRRLVARR
jgi:SAM-dependent methyltransferase